MAINVQFQNLASANSEILKAFNSARSAKALEAYQPLSAKDRKLEKLRALQILKQSSESETLGDIALNTDSLSHALTKADGATLQAMLNLLSAKMIEQNKYTYFEANKQQDLKQKIQEKLDDYQEKKEESKKEESSEDKKEQDKNKEDNKRALDKLIEAATLYFKEIQQDILEQYSKVLSTFTLDNLRKLFDESLKTVAHYAYEVPVESFKEYIIEPIENFARDIKTQIESTLQNGFKSKTTFSPNEIKTLLQNSLKDSEPINLPRLSIPVIPSPIVKANHSARKAKLENTIAVLDRTRKVKQQAIHSAPKAASKDLKLALHSK